MAKCSTCETVAKALEKVESPDQDWSPLVPITILALIPIAMGIIYAFQQSTPTA